MNLSRAENHPLQILIVEDCPDHADLIRRTLSRANHTDCTHTGSLSEGLREIDQQRFDVILLDLHLPDSQGIETVQAIKRASPLTPIIVLTTQDDVELSNQAIGSGAQDYVPKSELSGQSLSRAVRYAIERQRVVNENASLTQELRETVVELEEARETALTACRAKSDFLAGMSHEIRTPLTAILGFTDIALESQGLANDPSAHDAINTVHRSADHLLSLINNVLDAAKFEAGAVDIDILPVSITEVAQGIVELISPQAKDRKVDLKLVSNDTVPDLIDTDPTRLRQVLLNLASNAVKFTEAGEIVLSVSASEIDANRSRVCIEVADTGIGMTPEQLAEATNAKAFWQADTSTTRRFGGTGLGLWLSHSIASMLGGTLDIQSVSGEGTSCKLVIDVEVSASAPPRIDKPVAISKGRLEGLNVLVVDDSPDNRKLLAFYLEAAGARVTEAEAGYQAVAMIKDSAPPPFDAVLMDLHMPECDGAVATSLMLAAGFCGPILAITASTDPASHQACAEAGCRQVLTKPIDQPALIDAVAHHCQIASRDRVRRSAG